MKWSFAAIGMFVLGIIGVAAIILFQKLTTSNENDYYLLKEITEASMYDSIDYKYYRETGELKISREKFVETFTRRYTESTLFIGSQYIISFYDIIERPPKVSIIINTGINDYQIYSEETRANYNVKNALTAILEFVGKETYSKNNPYKHKELQEKIYYSMPETNNLDVTEPINTPEELISSNIKNVKIKNIRYEKIKQEELIENVLLAKIKKELDWTRAANGDSEYVENFFEEVKPKDYITNINVDNNEIYYYNCMDKSNKSFNGEKTDCSSYNNVWIHWSGTSNSADKSAILKIIIKWEYDEYEY